MGVLSQVQVLKVAVPDVGVQTLRSSGRSSEFQFSDCASPHQEVEEIVSQPLVASSMWFPSHFPDVQDLLS